MNRYIDKFINFVPGKAQEYTIDKQTELQEDFLKQLYNIGKQIKIDDVYNQATQLNATNEELETAIGALALKQEIVINNNIIGFTDKGIKHALKLIRAHRIYEQYLAEHSGYAPNEWHELAHRMEHLMSEEEEKKLVSILGNPLFDPHGDPIPTQSLTMPNKEDCQKPFEPNTWWKITHVEDDDKKLFSVIVDKGITNNSIIFVEKVDKTNNSFSFVYEGENMTLPLTAQEALNKVEISKQEASETIDVEAHRLTTINPNETALIVGLSTSCRGALRRRLMDLGFVKGSKVAIDMASPMGNPIAYIIRGSAIALRHDQARYVLIKKMKGLINE